MGNGATTVERPAVELVDTESQLSVTTLGKPTPPLPPKEELEKRLQKVFASMNLPADKIEVLKKYSDEKKWELICSQENFSAKEPPEYYLEMLGAYITPGKNKNVRVGSQLSSTEMVKDLEISLRTNSIEWVNQFLRKPNDGLDVLVNYLALIQEHEGWDQMPGFVDPEVKASRLSLDHRLSLKPQLTKKQPRRMTVAKIRFGEVADDIHACIMCLRAIMNHPAGLNQVIDHKNAINCIVLGLNHKVLRTKTLVLELLAAICLVSRGHSTVLSAFDNFKNVCSETIRFETLMFYFENYKEFHIDFMVACVQFFSVFVHSVEDMNFRVHLQYEFQQLGLNKFLEKLQTTETSERLSSHITAYLDNFIDVQLLMDESLSRTQALERVSELEVKLSQANDQTLEVEQGALLKLVEVEKQIAELQKSNQELKELCEEKDRRLSMSPTTQTSAGKGPPSGSKSPTASTSETEMKQSSSVPEPPPVACPAPPPPPLPPPPPPLPPGPGGFPLSANSGQNPPQGTALPIKKVVQPKYRLPALNWVTLNSNQIKGTMFHDLNDEKLFKVIDFNNFEELFKLGDVSQMKDANIYMDGKMTIKKAAKRVEMASVLDPNRMRNVAITRRKIEISDNEMTRAINSFDLRVVPLELVDILQRILPNDQEVQAYKEYELGKKPLSELSDEDKFMLNLVRIDHLGQKLQIMSYVGNFDDICNNLSPQLSAIIVASSSVKKSSKFKRVIEIVLAFGNYMNGAKRGAVYGFKLQSLDVLAETKSHDKRMSLLHYMVNTIREKFPDLRNFDSELKFVDKAATVSLENISADIVQLDKGMQMMKQEYEGQVEKPAVLKSFLNSADDKIKKLKSDNNAAQESYSEVLQYFGENAKTLAPHAFFSIFLRFIRAYKQAELDLDTASKLEESHTLMQETIREKKRERIRNSVVAELEQKQDQIKDRGLLQVPYHGAMEDLLQGLKNEPYRRADAVKRSYKKKKGGVVQKLNGKIPGNNFI